MMPIGSARRSGSPRLRPASRRGRSDRRERARALVHKGQHDRQGHRGIRPIDRSTPTSAARLPRRARIRTGSAPGRQHRLRCGGRRLDRRSPRHRRAETSPWKSPDRCSRSARRRVPARPGDARPRPPFACAPGTTPRGGPRPSMRPATSSLGPSSDRERDGNHESVDSPPYSVIHPDDARTLNYETPRPHGPGRSSSTPAPKTSHLGEQP